MKCGVTKHASHVHRIVKCHVIAVVAHAIFALIHVWNVDELP